MALLLTICILWSPEWSLLLPEALSDEGPPACRFSTSGARSSPRPVMAGCWRVHLSFSPQGDPSRTCNSQSHRWNRVPVALCYPVDYHRSLFSFQYFPVCSSCTTSQMLASGGTYLRRQSTIHESLFIFLLNRTLNKIKDHSYISWDFIGPEKFSQALRKFHRNFKKILMENIMNV